jgi:hypothetical protein
MGRDEGRLDGLLCSCNARPQKTLVGHAQSTVGSVTSRQEAEGQRVKGYRMSWTRRNPALLPRSSARHPERFETRRVSRSLSQEPPRTTRWPATEASVPSDLNVSVVHTCSGTIPRYFPPDREARDAMFRLHTTLQWSSGPSGFPSYCTEPHPSRQATDTRSLDHLL